MPIDWDKFDQDLNTAAAKAGQKTDAALAGKLSSISRLTDEEITELFPDPADAKKLGELMQIVKSAGDRNEKVNRIVANAEKFGGVVFTLLQKFA